MLSYYWVGDFLLFKVEQFNHKYNRIRWLKRTKPSELRQIILTAANIGAFQFEQADEFRFEGLMYDVVKVETKGADTIIYTCYPDRKETQLIAQYQEKIAQKLATFKAHTRHTPEHWHSTKLIKSYLATTLTLQWGYRHKRSLVKHLRGDCASYCSPLLSVNTPPPQVPIA